MSIGKAFTFVVGGFILFVGALIVGGRNLNTSVTQIPEDEFATDQTSITVQKINDFDMSLLRTGVYRGALSTIYNEEIPCIAVKGWGIDRGYGGLSCDFSQVSGALEFPENAEIQLQRISRWDVDRLMDGLYNITINEADGTTTECVAAYGWGIDRGYAGLSCRYGL